MFTFMGNEKKGATADIVSRGNHGSSGQTEQGGVITAKR